MTAAHFSPDRVYRYWLTRDTLPIGGRGALNMILLNPSTADETTDDPTIRRCIGYARSWSYSRLVVTNLFALRSTDPKALRRSDDPIGPDNDEHIRVQATLADRVVVGWGAHGHLLGRGDAVLDLLKLIGIRPFCLTRTNGGQPGHPLYLPKDLGPVPFERSPQASSAPNLSDSRLDLTMGTTEAPETVLTAVVDGPAVGAN